MEIPPPVPSAPHPPVQGKSGLAIASLVCGIAGLLTCGVSSLVGVVLGHMAISDIRKTGREGKGLAIGGLITSYVLMLIGGIAGLSAIATPAIMRSKMRAEQVQVTSNLKQVSMMLYDFEIEYGEFPSMKTQAAVEAATGVAMSRDFVEPFRQLEAHAGRPIDDLTTVPSRATGDWTYWVYEGGSVDPERPILLSPSIGGQRMLLKGDSSVMRVEGPVPSSAGTMVIVPAPRR